jgi:hypothetical protein
VSDSPIPTGGLRLGSYESALERRSRGIVYGLGVVTLWTLSVALGTATGLYVAGVDPAGVLGVVALASLGVRATYAVLVNVGSPSVG